MKQYPVNPALEAAVIADAEDDTPRLVYADWLDENGDPDRAAFIRTQIALWDKNPGDEDYVDLLELRRELTHRIKPLEVTWYVPRINEQLISHHKTIPYLDRGFWAHVHRGFPYLSSVHTPYQQDHLAPTMAKDLRDYLPKLIRTTTVRGLELGPGISRWLAVVLESNAARELSAISVFNHRDHSDNTLQTLLSSGVCQSLRWIKCTGVFSTEDAVAVARTDFPRIEMLEFLTVGCPPTELKRILSSPSFSRLRNLATYFESGNSEVGWAAVAELPSLHTLELSSLHTQTVEPLCKAERFPSIALLRTPRGFLANGGAKALAGLSMPSLRSLELRECEIRNDELRELANSSYFEQLVDLSLPENSIGDRGVSLLASNPCSKRLRRLVLGDNSFGRSGLAAIARPGAFPQLTTLDLTSRLKQKATSRDLAEFLRSVSIPDLRFLSLQGWRVGDEGAIALARNPSLSNLTQLHVRGAGIGNAGFRALAESPYLRGLIFLDVSDNPCRVEPKLLGSGKVFPALRNWFAGS